MTLSTPHLADACVRLGIAPRCAPAALRPIAPDIVVDGRVLPVRHHGSVDIFLEACERAREGDVLVIDDGGRTDQACVGDLTALEARSAGIAALVVWGLHRDTSELLRIGLPVLSLGSTPVGPLRVEPRADDALERARVGAHLVGADDAIVADGDGAIFLPLADRERILERAAEIAETEREQARRVDAGETLREQLAFAAYLAARERDPSRTFREHLREIGGAIEE